MSESQPSLDEESTGKTPEHKDDRGLKEFQAKKRLALEQFIARHEENLPALDFSEEEAVAFVPDELFMFDKINSEDLEIKVNPDQGADQSSEQSKSKVVIEITHQGDQIIKVTMGVTSGEIPSLSISSYIDCELIRGEGITRGFYDNLDQVAKALQFRTVGGQNHYENINYFVQKLDRYPLYVLNDSYFTDSGGEIIPREYLIDDSFAETVKFLYPEDKEKYVESHYLESDSWKKHCNMMCFPTTAENEANRARGY
ncbi:MAG: hypothetical protein ABII72_02080 [Parcubacteria group bacterium]